MKIQQILTRTLFGTIGLFKELVEIVNRRGRDTENRHRFPHVIIDDGVCMTSDNQIGQKSHILSNTILNHVNIGSYTYIGENSIFQNTSIGNYCSISREVFCGLGSHPLDLFSTSPLFYRRHNTFGLEIVNDDSSYVEYQPITIGNDVWIGARAIIMDGVTIGNGAVIAAGSIVTKDVPPYAIVAGVPAKTIRYRHNEENIKKLTDSNWWNEDPYNVINKMQKYDLL